jgi:hypothetical protein
VPQYSNLSEHFTAVANNLKRAMPREIRKQLLSYGCNRASSTTKGSRYMCNEELKSTGDVFYLVKIMLFVWYRACFAGFVCQVLVNEYCRNSFVRLSKKGIHEHGYSLMMLQ